MDRAAGTTLRGETENDEWMRAYHKSTNERPSGLAPCEVGGPSPVSLFCEVQTGLNSPPIHYPFPLQTPQLYNWPPQLF
jgi:hypothetical protein